MFHPAVYLGFYC